MFSATAYESSTIITQKHPGGCFLFACLVLERIWVQILIGFEMVPPEGFEPPIFALTVE